LIVHEFYVVGARFVEAVPTRSPDNAEDHVMGIAISILLGAVGAILRFSMTAPANQHGFNVQTAGVILMIAGAVGLVVSMLFWSSFSPLGRREQSVSRREETTTPDGQGRVVNETRDQVTR
jgi:hypothetical protein